MRSPRYATMAVALLLAACARSAMIESGGEVDISATPADARALPSGTALDVRLDREIGTKVSRVGDTFSVTVANPVIAANGETAVPAGSKIYGKVTGLDNSDHVGEQAAIKVDFERIVVNGESHSLYAKVMATNLQTRGESREETLRKAGVGAAAGAVLGAVLSGGELEEILKGGLLGAAAGTVISLGTGSVEAVLPAGTAMTLHTTRTVGLQ